METPSYSKSNASKVLIGMVVVFSAIMLAKFGFMFGQWLHSTFN